jgi:predicted phage terminase large subunit-like protein
MSRTKNVLTSNVVNGFVSSLLAKKFDGASAIPHFHKEWWDECCSEENFIAIAAPRSHAKSTAITFSFALAAILFRAHEFVIICSGTTSTSVLFLQDIKNEIIDNKELQELFGIPRDENGRVQFAKETEDDIIIEFEDGHKCRLMAKGAEQKLRGLKWGSKRPDLIIMDDGEDDEQVLNKDRREKFRKWFMGALIPARSMDGKVIIVGTILHLDSLLERLMPQEHAKNTVFDGLKMYSSRKIGMWRSIKYRAHNDDFSQILWKERYTKEWFKEKYDEYYRQGMPEVYAQEFLNKPLDESNLYFKRGDFVARTEDDRKKDLNYYISVDLAISESDRADYSVFIVGGMDDNGVLHVVNVIKERMDGLEITNTMMALQRLYDPVAFGVEEMMISKSIGPFLNRAMLEQNCFLNIVYLKPHRTDKITRARSIQARMRAGAVKFDKTAEWYPGLESEMMRFPRDRHDDQVDAMSYLGIIIDKMSEGRTEEEIEEEEYQDEAESSGLNNEGMSQVCGY